MNYYRRKDNPLRLLRLPASITHEEMLIPLHKDAEYTPEQRVAWGFYLDQSPTPEAGSQLGEVATWDEEQGTVTMSVEVVPGSTPEEIAATLQARLTQIQQGRRQWLDQNIDPDGLQLAMMLYQAGNAKGQATFVWCVALGTESSLRQAQLEAGAIDWDDSLADFSGMGPKPYTINELMIEAGL
ncbi:MAG: hypothetical protein Q7U44_10325 [Desulfuromonadales bacterium]|nr:hypothetical protein [Desulfuromonadales bacterium]